MNLKNAAWKVYKFGERCKIQIQEVEWYPNRINSMKRTPRHIAVQILQTKDEENICNVMNKETTPY